MKIEIGDHVELSNDSVTISGTVEFVYEYGGIVNALDLVGFSAEVPLDVFDEENIVVDRPWKEPAVGQPVKFMSESWGWSYGVYIGGSFSGYTSSGVNVSKHGVDKPEWVAIDV